MNAVVLEPNEHRYFHQDTENEYTSVTKVIANFKVPFDSEGMSSYKAIKDVFQDLGIWDALYNASGVNRNWKRVVPYVKANFNTFDKELMKKVFARKQLYLRKWDKTRIDAANQGTAFHEDMEITANASQNLISTPTKKDEKGTPMKVTPGAKSSLIHMVDYAVSGIFTEMVVYNDEYMVAGTIDRLEKHGVVVNLFDYKTNKELKTTAFNYKHMKAPLSELQDCNYNHYLIQLSTYGWMLEQKGYKVGKLVIEHVTRDAEGNLTDTVVPYIMEYRPDLVKRMLDVFSGKHKHISSRH